MKNTKLFLVAALVFLGSYFTVTKAQVNTDVYLSILWGNVTIGATGSFNFGSFPVSTTAVITGKQFTGTDYFWVEDMKWADSGYYTTIAATALTGNNWTIPATNIAMKVTTVTTSLINGTANGNVVVSNSLLSYTPINSAVTFIKRDAAVNAGKLGRYASYPRLQITIPAYQSVGSYHATLTYTIIEN